MCYTKKKTYAFGCYYPNDNERKCDGDCIGCLWCKAKDTETKEIFDDTEKVWNEEIATGKALKW